MWILFAFFASGAIDEVIYTGNWSVLTSNTSTINATSVAGFRITLEPVTKKDEQTFIKCSVEFDESEELVLNDMFDMAGILSTDGLSGFCYRTTQGMTFNEACTYLTRALKELNASLDETDNLTSKVIEFMNENMTVRAHQCAFSFVVRPGPVSGIYELPFRLNGVYNINNKLEVFMNGTMFNLQLFVRESRVFGVGMAVALAVEFYAWMWLGRCFNTNTRRRHLSPYALMLQIGFDLSAGFVLFVYVSMYSIRLIRLYGILFMFVMPMYFIKMQILSGVWNVNHEGEDTDVNAFRLMAILFFGETYAVMALTATAVSFVFSNPVPNALFLYSFWLPQIWHLIWYNYKVENLGMFVFMVSVSKTFPLAYFAFYKYSIMTYTNSTLGIAFLVYFWVQTLFLLLQCKFGGAFFIPKRCRRLGFDYSAERPETNTECPICMVPIEETELAMVTPCRHAFHRDCLLTWMEQDMICPVCRAVLPVERE